MNKTQWIVVSLAMVVFAFLYLGFDTKPSKHKTIEQQRALSAVSTDIDNVLAQAKAKLTEQEAAAVASMESGVEGTTADSAKADAYTRLSSTWYEIGSTAVAGYYAEKVAELRSTEEAWSIAGTTYSICLQREEEEKIRSYCTERAIHALESAASLNPSNVQHKLNLALVYTDSPPKDMPMKGILMLVELNKSYPENVPVLNQLGRLAIKTGQFDKAVQRLEKALSIEPDNPMSNCLLEQAYQGLGDAAKAATFKTKCDKLSGR